MAKIEWSEEKILEFVSEGWSLSYDKANDRFKLQKKVRGRTKSYTLPREFNEFCAELKETLKSHAEESKGEIPEEDADVEEEKSKKSEGKSKSRKSEEKSKSPPSSSYTNTLKALDKSHAKIVKNITERVTWFADALNEIGFYATLIAMQEAKVRPEELYNKIVTFRDPFEFASFVKEHLINLLEAKENAEKIAELRKKLEAMDLKLAVLEEALENVKRQRDQATIALYAATSVMDEEQLRNFVLNLAVAQYGLSVKVPGLEEEMRGVALVGGNVSKNISEKERAK